ncbi:MAG: hypothetical protein WCH11_03330 [Bdellovibrio sp.]
MLDKKKIICPLAGIWSVLASLAGVPAMAQRTMKPLRSTFLADFCDCHTKKSVNLPIQLKQSLDQKTLANLSVRKIQACVPVSIEWDPESKEIKYLLIAGMRVSMQTLTAKNPTAFNVPIVGFVHTLGVKEYVAGQGGVVEMDFLTDFFSNLGSKDSRQAAVLSPAADSARDRDTKLWKSHKLRLEFRDGDWGLYSMKEGHRVTEMLGFMNYKSFPIPHSRETIDIPTGLNGMGTFGPKPNPNKKYAPQAQRPDPEHGFFGHPGQTSALPYLGCTPPEGGFQRSPPASSDMKESIRTNGPKGQH